MFNKKVIGSEIENTIVNVGNQDIGVTISIGIATVTSENIIKDGGDIFKHADIALYYSKENGRNRVTHFNDIA